MSRLSVLAAAVLALAACDSVPGPSPKPAPPPSPAPTTPLVVGSWEVEDYRFDSYVTSEIDQTITLPASAGQGRIDVAGSVTSKLRYFAGAGVPSDSTQPMDYGAQYFFAPVAEADPPVRLSLQNGADESVIAVVQSRPSRRFELRTGPDDPVYTDRSGTVTVPARTLTDVASGETVSVSGQLTFPTLALQAGVETLVPYPRDAFYNSYKTPYFTAITFADDGSVTATAGPGLVSDTLSGQWEASDDGLVTVTYQFATNSHVETYAVEAQGGGLTVVDDVGRSTDPLGLWAAQYFAAPRSFASYRFEGSYRLRPAATD